MRAPVDIYLDANDGSGKVLVRVTPWAPRKALEALSHVQYLGKVRGTPLANASQSWLLDAAIVERVTTIETTNGQPIEHRERLDLDLVTLDALIELLERVITVNFGDPSNASRDGQPAQAQIPTRP